jgi:hypothetical protein
MPEGGKLNPGETITAPQIVLPGSETDDPNTPLVDERLPRVVTPFYTLPTSPPNPLPNPNPSPTPTPPPPPNPDPTPTPPPPEHEDDFWKQFSPDQEETLRWLIAIGTLKEDEARNGKLGTKRIKVDDEDFGCFYIQLPTHLGSVNNPASGFYATRVTGSTGDLAVIPPIKKWREYAIYDGIVKQNGAAYKKGLAPLQSVAEVKLGYPWLAKFILPYYANRNPRLQYNPARRTRQNYVWYEDMVEEINREYRVADVCKLEYFLSFNNETAFLAAEELFKIRPSSPSPIPYEYSITIHHIP